MAATAAADPGLLKCPKNLKECIDWVICIEKKTSELSKAVEKVLGNSNGNVNGLKTQLDKLADGLQKFLTGIKNGGSQNSSSYNGATWEELCKECKCRDYYNYKSCPCSCGPPSGVCDPSQCCPDCNVKKAARVFLCFLPCMWYALKFLKEKCDKDESKGGWKTFKINDNNNSLRHFLVGMGFDVGQLDGDKTGQKIFELLKDLFPSNGPLQSLYEKCKNYFTPPSHSLSHVSSTSKSPSQPKDLKTPSTVRDILLWLSGLPFASGFKALLKHCESLCLATGNPVEFNDFETSLYSSCFLLPSAVLTVIQCPGAPEGFSPSSSDWGKFCYPSDPFDLLDMLFENVRKVFVPLKFLCMQCERSAAEGGWGNCRYGRQCSVDPSTSVSSGSSSGCGSSCSNSNIYLCSYVSGQNKDVHDEHCAKSGQCINLNSGSCTSGHNTPPSACIPCPHPLMRFLLDGSEDSEDPQKIVSLFQPPEVFPKMGFSKSNLPANGWSGYPLYKILDVFVGKADSDAQVCFLRDLLRFLLCLTRTPPSTFGEIFSFYYKLAEWVDKNEKDQKKKDFKASLETEISSHPGTYGFGPKLTTAVYAVYGSEHQSPSDHSNTKYTLRLLSHCWGAKKNDPCGNFLFPLATNAWDLFAPSNSDVYLSWLCYFAKDFRKTFEELKGKFPSCCSSSCEKIVECPCALPFLYKNGFTFMKASNLSGKKCSNFIAQLGKFVGNSTLDKLIAEIEAFLWSIRFPFFFGFLYVWFFVLSYFFYVILIKLDTFHTGSHLHLPRSFKILPSTLFSDASSKLKDLSYFSL
ncbi:variant erythrocyte surface antigen-1 family protein [Babesia divergens]|uniref:Variant erythrocyte surface antigen-1 family protein n=1 Tax=Babesia divergens TaxID=32595 RepID=A0AAD9GD88_BABDI|nr:variant erythrocyte surface antigen-1 family protein [Babesia divergens]